MLTLKEYIITSHLNDEANISSQSLHPMETGYEGDGKETFCVHLPPQEKISFQVVDTKVVLSEHK